MKNVTFTTKVLPSGIELANDAAFTERVFLNEVVKLPNVPAVLIEWANARLAKLDKVNADRKNSDKPTSKAALENAKIGEDVLVWLEQNPGAKVASEVATAFGFTIPKANAVLSLLAKSEKVLKVQTKKSKPFEYSLIEVEEVEDCEEVDTIEESESESEAAE